jgi:hypothetical protein
VPAEHLAGFGNIGVNEIFNLVLKIGSLSGLDSLVYLIVQNFRQSPSLQLEFQDKSGKHYEVEGMHFYRFSWTGYVKNQSLSENTVTKFWLVVWRDRKKRGALRYGWGGLRVSTCSADVLLVELPIPFAPKAAKRLNVIFEIPVRGTSDERLLKEHIEIRPGLYAPVHDYEVCVEDVGGNLFDATGRFLNREGIDLRWQTEGAGAVPRNLDFRRKLKLVRCDAIFRARVLMKRLGLSR